MSAERMRVKGLKFKLRHYSFFPSPTADFRLTPLVGRAVARPSASDEPDWLARDLTPAFRAVSAGR